jgi:hypothetical protein
MPNPSPNPNLRPPWKPGQSGNPKGRPPKGDPRDPLSYAIMRAFEGGSWKRWEDLMARGKWAERFGAVALLRAREALVELGALASAQVEAHDGTPLGVAWRATVPGRGEPPKRHGPHGPAVWHEGMGCWVYMVPRRQAAESGAGAESAGEATELSVP